MHADVPIANSDFGPGPPPRASLVVLDSTPAPHGASPRSQRGGPDSEQLLETWSAGAALVKAALQHPTDAPLAKTTALRTLLNELLKLPSGERRPPPSENDSQSAAQPSTQEPFFVR